MKNAPIVVHIPHSGTFIPNEYLDNFIPTPEELNVISKFYCDSYTDILFSPLCYSFPNITNQYNRLLFDVERFDDDSKEPMSMFGLGWFYENSPLDGSPIRDTKYKEELHKLYLAHHTEFAQLVTNSLSIFDQCLIIDCHSFNPERTWFQSFDDEFPDICIGFELFHNHQEVVDSFSHHFRTFNIAFNSPYSGSIVPIEHFLKNPKVFSIMIEVNKKIYLNNQQEPMNQKISEFHRCLNLFISDLNSILRF